MFAPRKQGVTKKSANEHAAAPRDSTAEPTHNVIWQSLALHRGVVQTKRNESLLPSSKEEVRQVHQTARQGVSTPGEPLPFLERIQPLFGRHDVSRLVAHTGTAAAGSLKALGAKAYTVGNHLAFAGKPDLYTAAHEAAHAVQQQGGLSLPDGIGRVGDRYEQHADAVAELVTRGSSAESLLNQYGHRQGTTSESPASGQNQIQGCVQFLELTYDDGPDANTQLTLNALKQGGARATFYLVGQKVQAGDNWKIVFDIAAAGNWLGNHAFDWNNATGNHIFLSGTRAQRASKLLQTEFAIRDALLKGKADAQANKKWESIAVANRTYIDDVIATGTGRFRTPGFRSHWHSQGGTTQQQAMELASKILESAGLRRLAISDFVDIDPKDWEKGKTQQDIEKSVTDQLSSDSDSILLHSRLSATAAATPAILEAIKAKRLTYQAPAQGQTTGATGAGFSGLNTSVEWIESFDAISQIGPATSRNVTDPVDRTITTQVGVLWIDYVGVQYLAVVSLQNVSIGKTGSKIEFISFVHQDLKDKAINRALPHLKRGIQTLGKQYILYAPPAAPATTAVRT